VALFDSFVKSVHSALFLFGAIIFDVCVHLQHSEKTYSQVQRRSA
jgi:hypothetical protein